MKAMRAWGLALAMVCATSLGANAAVATEIIDAFPRGGDAAIDTSVSLSWEMSHREGRILREDLHAWL